ncbi:hypothetical protein PIB30_062818 [Stylosanthes scabra]|uniref:Uncharacterized protein n=1 Tax=Stylosanthes scabra TaxID=79078 RepID=A0ABU6QLN4_9FABA|nr:hypothetical protein [Stylosanthes scabra]
MKTDILSQSWTPSVQTNAQALELSVKTPCPVFSAHFSAQAPLSNSRPSQTNAQAWEQVSSISAPKLAPRRHQAARINAQALPTSSPNQTASPTSMHPSLAPRRCYQAKINQAQLNTQAPRANAQTPDSELRREFAVLMQNLKFNL